MAAIKRKNILNDKKENGFTLVEILVVLVVLSIVAAIAVPVTLSIIDNSRQNEAKNMAKEIMNSVQTEFNQLGANNELWYSIVQEMAIILNKDRKNYGKGFFSINEANQDIKDEFKTGFIDISKTVPVQNIFKRIENADDIDMLYVGAGNAYYYEFTYEDANDNDRKKMYMAYVIIFSLNDDDKIYFYDGNEVTTQWPFSEPLLNTNININTDKKALNAYGQNFKLKNNNTVLQLYALKINDTKRCDEYWKEVVLKNVKAAQ